MRSQWIAILLMIILPCVSFADVYEWKDERGVTHFSDQPRRGAKRIELKEAQTYSLPEKENPSLPPKHTTDDMEAKYFEVKITQPASESTIRNNQGFITVHVGVDPQLADGDKIALVFDGQVVGEPGTSTSFTLSNVYRGTHTLAAKIIDPEGETLMMSESITFHMQRASVIKK